MKTALLMRAVAKLVMRKPCGGMRARLIMMRMVNKQSTLGDGNAFTPTKKKKKNDNDVLLVAASRDPVRVCVSGRCFAPDSVSCLSVAQLFSPPLLFPDSRRALALLIQFPPMSVSGHLIQTRIEPVPVIYYCD